MPRRKAEAVEDDGPSKAWLDSYADAMTLLLAFFVLLYAFSLVDERKFAEFKFGVEQAFSFSSPAVPEGSGFLEQGEGIHENAGAVAVVPADLQNEIDEILQEVAADQLITPNEVQELRDAIEARLEAELSIDLFQVETDPRGVVVTLNESLLFASGSALVGREGVEAIGGVASVLSGIDNEILVEGHTDSVPTTGTQWPTNWELSGARATAVLRVLNEVYGIAGERLSAVGHADTQPRDTNETREGRQANRRTELVVLVEPDSAEVTAIPLLDEMVDESVSDPLGLEALAGSSTDVVQFEEPVFSPVIGETDAG